MPETIELWGVSDPNISAQLALAFKLDLFKREAGLDVSCKFIESGTTMANDVLNAEKPPFAFTQTPITALLLHEKGVRTKLVAPLADIAGTQQVIIRASSGIATPKDLHGKRMGMARGAAIYLALQHMAKDCSVDLNLVHFLDLLPHEQLEAFKAGTIDAIASWEPWTTRAQQIGGLFYFSGTHSKIPGMEGNINWLTNQSCLIVPDAQLEKQPELVVAILTVLRKATDLINNHRKNVADALASFFGISQIELLFAMQKNAYSLTITNLFRLGILGFRDFFYESGRISSKFPENVLYETTCLRQVDPALVFLEDTTSQDVTIIEEDGIYYRNDFTLHGAALGFLVADDSRYVRAALTRAVKSIGGTVVGEATSGSEVLEIVAHTHVDVVTVDLSMPGVSGLEAIKILLQIDPAVTVIVISGMDLQEVQEEVFNMGAKMYIQKPFDLQKVTAVLAKAVSASE